jgi:hypothetical protein
MAFKIAIYHGTVPNNKSLEKIQMLQFFGEGAKQMGDQVIDIHDTVPIESDVAVIQGWIANDLQRPHLKLRSDVITQQLNRNRYVVTADSNLFLYTDTTNPLHYLRYSFNGVFPNTGNYFIENVDPNRWTQIQHDLNIQVKDYRTHGDHILICLQRSGGWSMGLHSVADWAESVVRQLRQHTNRPIVLRAHPGDKQSKFYLKKLDLLSTQLRFSISLNKDIRQDLVNCWAVVNHNSSPAVAAAIEGVPVFVTDPERSQCQAIANTDLAQIEQPLMPDRTAWLQRLAMSHWKFDELRSGQAWSHMRTSVRDIA